MVDIGGPWELCPHCAGRVLLSAYYAADDEPAMLVTVCPACARHVTAAPPPDPRSC